MHDLILAKQITDLINHLAVKHELKNVQKVSVEIGDVGNLHEHVYKDEHHHSIEISNLEFHLKNFFPKTKFQIRKKKFEGWKLVDIEGE